jgi:zinc protease
VAERFFRVALFGRHPYGRSVTGGSRSVAALTVDDARQAYGSLLASSNVRFAFAGDIDEQRARHVAGRIAGVLPAGGPAADTVPEPSSGGGRRLVFVDKPERTQTQILIGCLGTHPHDADHVALHVGSTIFGGTFTARLMREVRSKRGWSYGAYSNLPYDRHRRGFSLWTFPKASDAAACIALELDLLEKWHDAGVTPRELKWAQRYLVRSHAFAVDTASKRVGQALDEELYDLPAGYHSDYLKSVQAVTVEEVNAAIRARVTPEDLVVTVLGTASDTEAAVRAAIPRLADARTVAFDSED